MTLIIIAIIAIATESLQEISQEYTVKKYDYKVHMLVKFAMIAGMIFIWDVLNLLYRGQVSQLFLIDINMNSIIYVVGIISAVIISTIIFNKLLKKSSMYILGIILNLNIIIVLLIEIFRNEMQANAIVLTGVITFLIGIYMILFKRNSVENKKMNTLNVLGMLILLLLGLVIPYLQQMIFRNYYMSKELLTIIESISVSLYALLILKPKIKLDKEILKNYFIQSLLCAIASILFKMMIEQSVFYYKITFSFVMVTVTILSILILKTKITIRQFIGVFAAVIGYILINMNTL